MIRVGFFTNKPTDFSTVKTIHEAMSNDKIFKISMYNNIDTVDRNKLKKEDYIILTSSYEINFNNLAEKCHKIGYVCYGPLIKYAKQYPVLNQDQTKIWKYFVGDKFNKEFILGYMGENESKIVKSGHPKYDLMLKAKPQLPVYEKYNIHPNEKVILYMPTVQISYGYQSIYSTFKFVIGDILKTCSKINAKLMIKGHPFLFRYLRPLDFSKHKNVIYTETNDYQELAQISTLGIADGSGIVLEYYHTQKPLILLLSQEAYKNPILAGLAKGCYLPVNRAKLSLTIASLLDGQDHLKMTRQNVLNSVFFNLEGDAGYKITEYIRKDYYDGQRILENQV